MWNFLDYLINIVKWDTTHTLLDIWLTEIYGDGGGSLVLTWCSISYSCSRSSVITSRFTTRPQQLNSEHFDLNIIDTNFNTSPDNVTNTLPQNISLKTIYINIYSIIIMSIYKLLPTDENYINEEARGMCLFYKNSYLRLRRWFGFSTHYWLCEMTEEKLLINILRMVVPDPMYILFINISIRIRKKHGRPYDVLLKYKIDHPDLIKKETRSVYYKNNVDKFRTYSKNHYLLKQIPNNLFKKK